MDPMPSEHIPTLADLALRYGTINQTQFDHITRLHTLVRKEKKSADYASLLLGQKMATRYQLGLLRLIREYRILRGKGEEFGRIAVEKGLATPQDIQRALDVQKKAFRQSRQKKLIGDILVEDRVITAGQKEEILREQILYDETAREIFPKGALEGRGGRAPELSDYEQQFLKIKSLDREFSAAVLEKGLAGKDAINRAAEIQERAFETKKTIKILGDIMVELNLITEDQKNQILREQGRHEEIGKTPALALSVTKDAMAAWIETNPDNPATLDEINALASAESVTHGRFPDALIQGYLDQGASRFPLARMDHSQALRDARGLTVMLDQDLNEKGEKRKGDVLASQNGNRLMGQRQNIFGKKTLKVSDMDFTIRCGSGTRLSTDKTRIIAAKTGVPGFSVERYLYIHPIIHVLEDADLRYGPLEPYANLTVSGTITGAYPVTAGHVSAEEIRGGRIDAIGDVRARVGITDAVIRAQGDVHARYIHNSTIETFGNVYVENEVFDSNIRCSGRMDSPECRAVASRIYAKKGVILMGTGSEKTVACNIAAGGEHHILGLEQMFRKKIDAASGTLKDLEARQEEQKDLAKKTFQKMVEIKIFHDRAKEKKTRLSRDYKTAKEAQSLDSLKNIQRLHRNFDKRMKDAVVSLKELNQVKKGHDKTAADLEKEISRLKPRTRKKVLELEKSIYACLEWARDQESRTVIEIRGKAFQGTQFSGVYSTLSMETPEENITLRETLDTKTHTWRMESLKADQTD